MTGTTLKKPQTARALLPLLLLLCGTNFAPAFKGFLFLQGIPGESIDSRHADWIDVESFSQAVSKSGITPSFSELWLQKSQDKSSPELALRAANGKPIPRALLRSEE